MNSDSGTPKSRQVGVYLVIFILATGWVVTVGLFSTTYRDQLTANQDLVHAASALRHELQEVQSRITDFERHLHNQTALIARLTGDIIPIQMPPDWEAKLAQLEAVVHNSADWPSNPESAREFFQEVRKIIQELPSWAEGQYLERLASLRWSALVFQQIHPGGIDPETASDTDPLDQIEANFNTLVELPLIAPLTHDQDLMRALRAHIEVRQKSDATEIKELAIEQAEKALSHKPPSDAVLLKARLWLERIPDQDEEIRSLQRQLQREISKIEAEQLVQHARTRYDQLKVTAAGNPVILEQGERILLSEIGTTQASLAFDGISIPELDALRSELEVAIVEAQTKAHAERISAEEARHKEAMRAYQAWALSKLREFERKTSNLRQTKASSWALSTTREFRYALVELLKIDTRLLDWALAEAFHSTLQSGSQLILEADRKGNQMAYFINQSVEVTKVGLDEIPGEQ